MNVVVSAIILVFCASIFAGSGFAQDEVKGIKSDDFVKKRDSSKRPKSSYIRRKKSRYRVVRSSVKSKKAKTPKRKIKKTEEAFFGLTVWKLRPAKNDDVAKELVEEDAGNGESRTSEFTLERIESHMPLIEGERIRLSVESLSHSGYLYVIDRELYEDGTYSSPILIYPTLRTRLRNYQIKPGDLAFIPEGARNFRVKSNQSEKVQVAEVLTFIISPNELIDQSILQTRAINLPLEDFSKWIEQWEVDPILHEEIDGAGKAITLV